MDDHVMNEDCKSQAAAQCLLQLSLPSTASPSPSASSAQTIEDEKPRQLSTSPSSLGSKSLCTSGRVTTESIENSPGPIIDEPTTILADGTLEFPCMYDDNCDTDAPRRKCISHIFGRNKTCTRKIPKGMWLYHCRKHYQRARYRADGEWAREQSAVIRRQFARLREWDEISGWNIQPVKKEREAIIAGVLGSRAAPPFPSNSSSGRKKRKISSSASAAAALDGEDSGVDGSLTGTWAWLRSEFGAMSSDGVHTLLTEVDRLLHEHEGLKFPRIEILASFPAEKSASASRNSRKAPKKAKRAKYTATATATTGASTAATTADVDALPTPMATRRSSRIIVKALTQRTSKSPTPPASCRPNRLNRMAIDHMLN